jgi:hypothetical protein
LLGIEPFRKPKENEQPAKGPIRLRTSDLANKIVDEEPAGSVRKRQACRVRVATGRQPFATG